MDLGDAARLDPALEEFSTAGDRETEVDEAALVTAAGGVADDDGQDVHADVVVVRPPDGAADQEPAVAAAEVEDDRRPAAEELFPIQPPIGGKLLEGGLGPERRVEDFAGDGDAELALDAAAGVVGGHTNML